MILKEEWSRTALVLGEAALERLANARVAVFGVGGVGGFVCEALARAGVGNIALFDADTVSLSNINRQLVALHSTVGRPKVEVMAERITDINPNCRVLAHRVFYLPENADDYPLDSYDYVVDAIDTVSAKIELAVRCSAQGIPLIASMGTGNRLDASLFSVTDISKTHGCPLARVMRRELRNRGITHLRVLFSPEPAATPTDAPPAEEVPGRRSVPGSISFVPSVAGLLIAGQVVRELAAQRELNNAHRT